MRIYYSTDFASNRKASEELLIDVLKCEGLLEMREFKFFDKPFGEHLDVRMLRCEARD